MSRRVSTVYIGSGEFGLPAFEALAAHPEVELVGVVTAPARPADRRSELRATPIARAAGDRGIDALTPTRLRAPEAIGAVLDLRPRLAVLADYGQLVPAPILDLPLGALNLHPSLLPRHRGATPIPAAILAGDAETGVTLFRMDEGLDTGPILAARRTSLDDRVTAPELRARLADLAAGLLTEAIGSWIAGSLQPVPQADEEATFTKPLRRDDGRLDPGHPAEALGRQVRAYQPWPGSWFETADGRVVVWRARVVPGGDDPIGTLGPDGLSTVDGRLALEEVQPAGGRRMSWAAYLRGRPHVAARRIEASRS